MILQFFSICIITDGTTFHAGLRFQWKNRYVGVTEEVMESLRRQFENMHFIIIDELSLGK